ncbi:hypothetical protein [Thermaerobacter sp. PB12/4term]|uniref:hypothetical protein n=1 Tax=Thermaerobacter sp. PB12/4term TaxID=2293838 RepID=UPI00193F5B2B|nr:hypothetical protein [Thermaerobacter sp. PB12/4term]
MSRLARGGGWGVDLGTTGLRWVWWSPAGGVEPVREGGRGPVAASLPVDEAIFRVLPLPPVSRRELAAALRWELQRILPFPVDDAIFDYVVIPDAAAGLTAGGRFLAGEGAGPAAAGQGRLAGLESGPEGGQVVVAGAAVPAVDARFRALRQHGIRPQVLEPEWVTWWRVARFLQITVPAGHACGVVDLGATASRLIVVDPDGRPVAFHRSAAGGIAIDTELAGRLAVPVAELRRLKDAELAGDTGVLSGCGSVVELLGDVARLLRRSRQETAGAPLVLWAAGGGARWPALVTLLAEAVGDTVRVPGEPRTPGRDGGPGLGAGGEAGAGSGSSFPQRDHGERPGCSEGLDGWAWVAAESLHRCPPEGWLAAGLALWHAVRWARSRGRSWPRREATSGVHGSSGDGGADPTHEPAAAVACSTVSRTAGVTFTATAGLPGDAAPGLGVARLGGANDKVPTTAPAPAGSTVAGHTTLPGPGCGTNAGRQEVEG